MPKLIHNGQSLYYTDSGRGPITLIFSHGLLMDNEMFNQQIEFFKDKYRCIAWDERAHGQTASDSIEAFNYYDSADDLVAILDELNIQKAILVGMSQGGYLSLRCALKHRDRVSALVLIDTQAQLEDPEKLMNYKPLFEQWIDHGLTQDIADFIARVILGADAPERFVWQEKWKSWQPHNLAAAFNALLDREDISEDIAKLKLPAIVIHGENDIAIGLDRAKDMALRLNSELAVILDAGHAANLTHAEQVNQVLDNFLNTLTQDS
ncbi:alpha/beta fold hydrolase [Acinetobacter courvalinii]|uniref:alpha/beta fold hydrolase n=1 Tax=Acinetobacter courvalinii TaxID=280147 RepID=UPI0021CF89B0|nr:alpha/beta hydrolase [Acinetobacter courvalinii]MCU4638494.1 alpha/beta hydrolase [Acinetobacter courvalinii]